MCDIQGRIWLRTDLVTSIEDPQEFVVFEWSFLIVF